MAVPLSARPALEVIAQNGQTDNRNIESRREQMQQDDDNDDDDAELTDLEKQIVAKYLSELGEGPEDDDPETANCDLNNNCHELMGISAEEKKCQQSEEEDKENNQGRVIFSTTKSKDDLTAVSMLLRQFPQLNRRTSLESTGDSVEDLVSACPPIVHLFKQAAAAAAAAATATATSSTATSCTTARPSGTYEPKDIDSQFNVSRSSPIDCNSSTSFAGSATDFVVAAAAAAASSGQTSATNACLAGFCNSAINSEKRQMNVGDANERGTAEQLLLGRHGSDDEKKGKAAADKAIKKRPNYSVWMGVTSCIWGLVFYLMKNYW